MSNIKTKSTIHGYNIAERKFATLRMGHGEKTNSALTYSQVLKFPIIRSSDYTVII